MACYGIEHIGQVVHSAIVQLAYLTASLSDKRQPTLDMIHLRIFPLKSDRLQIEQMADLAKSGYAHGHT
jgi:hypothetical protein